MNGKSVESVLLHREYPRKGTYRRHRDRESEKDLSGKGGHFDPCVWNPSLTEQRAFRAPEGKGEQRTLATLEFSLN